jgi:hypothetical protein
MKGRFVLITLLGIYNLAYAQKPYTLPQVTPKSPNVAGYEKYGNIPVSLSTGVPNISIPLTSITVDGLTIPITLSYHNTGLKVEEIPSMMGLGFDLQCGGAISYNQRGINDFNSSGGLLASGALQDLKDYFNGVMTSDQIYDYFERILNSEEDSEFDLYNMNFLGYSNSFYFDTTGKGIITPKEDLKVYKIDTGLKVIDNTGNQFYFQTAESATSYDAATLYILPTFADISAWHISKIITKNGRIIKFKYKHYTLHYTKTVQFITYYPLGSTGCPGNSNDYSDNLVTQSFLLPDSILFDQGYVKFNLSNSPRQDLLQYPLHDSIPSLSGFYIVNSSGQKVSEFSFNQGYFDSNNRLKLVSVQEKSDSEVAKEWDFGYYGETSSFPSFFSKAQDHWGYYNGKTSNATLIPQADYVTLCGGHYTDLLSGNYADRTSDFNYSKIGLLQTIKQPTGGTTTFEYEPNQIRVNHYSDIVTYPFLKWSSAIPTITQDVANANTITTGNKSDSFTLSQYTVVNVTTYEELDPSSLSSSSVSFTGPSTGVANLYSIVNQHCTTSYCQGSGSITLEPGTYHYSVTRGFDYNLNRNLECNFDITTQVVDTSGTLPPFQAAGGRISQIFSNDSIAAIRSYAKKFIYNDSLNYVIFRNIPYYIHTLPNYMKSDGTAYCAFCSNEFKIHSESVIPFAGSNIEYLHVTELVDTGGTGGKTEYDFLGTSNDGGNNEQPYCAPVNTSWRAGLPLSAKVYKYNNGSYSLIQETTNSYFTGSRTNYANGVKVEYSTFCTLKSSATVIHTSGMSTLFTEQFYPNQSIVKEYLNGTISNITNTTAQSSFHTLPTLVEKFDSKDQSLKEKTIYSFDFDTTVTPVTSDAVAIKQLVRQNILVPIEQVQIKTMHDTDYVVGATLYTYKQDKPVINKIYSLGINAPVSYTAFTQSAINGSGIFVKDSRYEERIIESKYDEFNNVIEQYKSSDSKSSYIWDYKKYYPVAETVNADSNSIAYTSFEADGNGNWSIGSSLRDTTEGITGKLSYQLSNGNITKSNLIDTTDYIVSYWKKDTNALTITGTQGLPKKGRTINGWTCIEHTINGVTAVTLSGTGTIDELRLYPKAAQMTTYTYDPLIGMTSQCDLRNNILYYEYDEFGRLKIIRDQDQNILKTFNYKYQEQQ